MSHVIPSAINQIYAIIKGKKKKKLLQPREESTASSAELVFLERSLQGSWDGHATDQAEIEE